MFSTNLNSVKFEIGTIVVLTDEFRKANKPMVKCNKLLATNDEFEIIAIKESDAEDEFTELTEKTIGALKLQHVKTGEILDIEDPFLDEKDVNWAFFTNHTPDMFIIK